MRIHYAIEAGMPTRRLDEKADIRAELSKFIEQQPPAQVSPAQAGNASLNLLDVVNLGGMRQHGDEYFGAHPVHGSLNGNNFHVNPKKGVWHCFRCDSGGDAFYWLAVQEGIIQCDQAIRGGLRGADFKKTWDIAVKRGLIKKPHFDAAVGGLSGLTEKTKTSEAAIIATNAILQTFSIASMIDTGEVLVYNDGVYHPGVEGIIAKRLEELFAGADLAILCTNQLVNETLGHVKRATSIKREAFDADPYILNVKNGLLDVRTFEFKPHRSDYLSVTQLPVTYDADAKCTKIQEFLNQVLYPDDKNMVQESVGACLYRFPLDKAFLAWGSGGNGKSVFLRLLKTLLGNENVSAISLQDLEIDRFASSQLYGKLANIHADLPDAALKTTGKFKMTTSIDPISAQKKFKDHFSFVSYAKQFYSCNKIPETPGDDSDAFFRRWNIITFPNKFEGTDREDKKLLEKLTTPEELSGFLNYAIDGLKRLQNNGMIFSNAQSTEEVRLEYTLKSSPLKAFLLERCITEPDAQVPKQELFNAFAEYSRQKKMPVVTSDTFFKNLPKEVNVTTHQIGRIWHFKGVRLMSSEELERHQKTLDGADA